MASDGPSSFLSTVHAGGRGSRFSLLHLEYNEFLIQDYAVFMYPAPTAGKSWVRCAGERCSGRLKLCTRGLVFEPEDKRRPLQRFPFKSMTCPPVPFDLAAGSAAATAVDAASLFSVASKVWLDIEVGGNVAPFVTHENPESMTFVFQLHHSPLLEFLPLAQELQSLEASRSSFTGDKSALNRILESRTKPNFELRELVDFREKLLLRLPALVEKIVPLVRHPGIFMVTDKEIYFQPSELNNLGDGVEHYSLRKIVRVHKRRHMLRPTAVEIYLNDGTSALFNFATREACDEVLQLLRANPSVSRALATMSVRTMLNKWQNRELSNFEYLTYLNSIADRSIHDLTQYPVFPWVIQDYTSSKLDLQKPSTFRDLSKPIGALNRQRLEYFQERYRTMPEADLATGIPPPFLYGSHYSTPGYVLFYLVRSAPQHMLCLQSGKFDAPDRMFHSISETWLSVLRNPSDVKELIPEFYASDGDFLVNSSELPLGSMQDGEVLGDVKLPPWARSPRDFVRKCRKALESDYVSEHLHEWIDLIFGYKQQGKAAVDAQNLFYYLTYEGAVDLDSIDNQAERDAIQSQINEFGQCPKQLFASAHPSRNAPASAAASMVVAESLTSPTSAALEVPPAQGHGAAGVGSGGSAAAAAAPATPSPPPPPPPPVQGHRSGAAQDAVSRFPEPQRIVSTGRLAHPSTAPAPPTSGMARVITEPPRLVAKTPSAPSPAPSFSSSAGAAAGLVSARATATASVSITALSDNTRLHKEVISDMQVDHELGLVATTCRDGSLRVTPLGSIASLPGLNGRAGSDAVSQRQHKASDLALSGCAFLDIARTSSSGAGGSKALVCGSWDSSIFLYSLASAQVIGGHVPAHDDSVSAVDAHASRVCSGSWDATVKVWRLRPDGGGIDPVPVAEFYDHQNSIQVVRFHPTGRYVAAGADDGRVVIWNVEAGSTEALCVIHEATANLGAVRALGWGGRGMASLFVGGSDGSINEFSMSGSLKCSTNTTDQVPVQSITVLPNAVVAGCSDGTVELWRWVVGEPPSMLTSVLAHDQPVSCVRVDPESRVLAVAADADVRLWSISPL